MAETVIPPSPNWYCSKVVDSTDDGLLAFAARHDIYVFKCSPTSLNVQGIFCGHTEKVTAMCVSSVEPYKSCCCSASEDGVVKVWDLTTQEVKAEHKMHSVRNLSHVNLFN